MLTTLQGFRLRLDAPEYDPPHSNIGPGRPSAKTFEKDPSDIRETQAGQRIISNLGLEAHKEGDFDRLGG